MSITITTWNVNSLKVRQPQVLDFLKETENSILCLQELKMQEADIDAGAFKEILMFPCVNYPRVFTYLNRSSTF